MSWRPFYRRLFSLPGRRRERDLDEEIEFHIARIVDQLVDAGWSLEAARHEARRRFGDPVAVRAACRREEDGMMRKMTRWADMVRLDVSFAFRQMIRRPLVNSLAVVTLVLGIGATSVVFSVVYAVVLEALPFSEPERLVQISQTSPQGRQYSISEPNLVDFRARQSSLVDMAGMGFVRPVLTGREEAETLQGMRVSHTFFPLLGVDPVLGRNFASSEDVRGGADRVALLSEAAWTRRFGRDPGALGQILTLDGIGREIVGVVPSDRAWPGVEVFMPLSPETVEERDNQIIESIGRMAPGMTIDDVRADMSAIAADLSDEHPASNDGWGARVNPLHDYFVGRRLTRMGYFLLGAVGLLLLMACASVTNLRVAQASVRMQEMGVRAALGAGRRRIAMQLLAEGLVLAVIGGVIAVGLTYQAIPLIKAIGPSDIGRLHEATLNGPVLGVALAAGALAVLLSALAPALLVSRSGILRSLRSAGRNGAHGARLRNALVVSQFALAVAVVLGAGLMTRSFMQLSSVDLGFEPEGMVRFSVRLPHSRFQRGERYPQLVRLMDEIEAIPGVVAAGTTHAPPFGWMTPSNFVARSDREPDRQQDFLPVSWRGVAGDYFEAIGVPLLAGRTFRPEDNLSGSSANPPVILDRALADLLWPNGEDPIGELITWFLPGGRQCEVVGLVGNARDERVDAGRPRIYRPYGFTSWYEPAVLVRTAGDPGTFIPAIRRAALRVDPDAPAMSPTPVREDFRQRVAWPRFIMQVLAAFSAAALVLAALGIYGVTAFNVSRRRREIGLRVALGAEPSGVIRLVLRNAMVLAAAGIGIGIALSYGLTRFLGSLLYEVSATDPLTFLAVPVLLGAVALGAAWLPALRAVRVNPRDALTAD